MIFTDQNKRHSSGIYRLFSFYIGIEKDKNENEEIMSIMKEYNENEREGSRRMRRKLVEKRKIEQKKPENENKRRVISNICWWESIGSRNESIVTQQFEILRIETFVALKRNNSSNFLTAVVSHYQLYMLVQIYLVENDGNLGKDEKSHCQNETSYDEEFRG